jgi:hypothetical protein
MPSLGVAEATEAGGAAACEVFVSGARAGVAATGEGGGDFFVSLQALAPPTRERTRTAPSGLDRRRLFDWR